MSIAIAGEKWKVGMIRKSNGKQSILYQDLGTMYKKTNINQAYLCYENALFHYAKEAGKEYIKNPESDWHSDKFLEEYQAELEFLRKQPQFCVQKTAIIILSYNHAEITKDCIRSIRRNNASDTYELIVVDNASTDGIVGWLRVQDDIKLIENKENRGFPYGCNQGIAAAGADSDIFLLNNDTIVPENAVFWLRMGLYEDEKTGAAGSVSNNVVNYQQVAEQFESTEQWIEFAKKRNVPMDNPYEKKGWLVGFAMLIKRTAMENVLQREGKQDRKAVREVLDQRFSPGNFEDNDFSIRLLLAGYCLRLVKNSFIFHYGSKAFQRMQEKFRQLLISNRQKLAEKYGIDFVSYSYVDRAIIEMIQPKERMNVLEVGCKLGAVLARIESIYPQAEVLGLEKNVQLAELAAQVTNVLPQDFLTEYKEGSRFFDVIIFDETLDTVYAEQMLEKAKRVMTPGGSILMIVQNSECVGQMPHKKGRSSNAERLGQKQFCLSDIINICNMCSLQINQVNYRKADLSQEEQQEVLRLCGSNDTASRIPYEAEKYVLELRV